MRKLNIAIVGATGAVGQTIRNLLEERNFPYGEIFPIASESSKGTKVVVGNKEYEVVTLDDFDFSKVDIAFFSAGTGISNEWGRYAAKQGALVIDNTNAFRMCDDVSLVVPQANGDRLMERPESNIIANPNCSTIPVVRALSKVRKHFGLKKMVVSTYQAASGAGLTGMDDLKRSATESLDGIREPHKGRFEHELAFNLIPMIDVLQENGFTLEEQKILQESRKIYDDETLEVSATAVRVPVVNCHSEAVYFECQKSLDENTLLELLETTEEVTLYKEKDSLYPTPKMVNGDNNVHIGRVRIDPINRNCGWVWVVSDNLLVGAALNAVQIAEKVAENGALR